MTHYTMVAEMKANGVEGEKKVERSWIMGSAAFNSEAVHQQGIKELWEKKWKFPVPSP